MTVTLGDFRRIAEIEFGTFYRYDNFPNTAWRNINSYPYHFHNGAQDTVIATPFSTDLLTGFREFMDFVAVKVAVEQ